MADQPSKRKKIIGGVVWTLIFLTLGVIMLVNPDLTFAEEDGPSGRRGRTLFVILQAIRGVPGGVVLVLLGLLSAAGTFMAARKTDTASQ